MSERRSLVALCLLPVVEESSYLQGVAYMELAGLEPATSSM